MLIRIKNLALKAIVGVNAWEQLKPQKVVINVEIEFDGEKAGETDSFEDTVDYKKIKKRILRIVEESRCRLLEALARRISDAILEEPRVLKATVEVDKPKALRFAESVSVVCSAERSSGRKGVSGRERLRTDVPKRKNKRNEESKTGSPRR
jgi:FolB domain-containing protein